ncbi:cysteine hydrolase family protein [Altericroceibacterium endophyticum]|uniref:Isochorismatase family protein n=1 Tax=Altericroceibacterium endophyticum TaxID=1808508 RepID=A0A6I4T2B1_9SPHN|nr:isochorismatase family cysteine hydrolase [Altericroceibacterium endophyticum]MXO65018.1 isochorismatase family protein [Altericroceibacterium endophyticum]
MAEQTLQQQVAALPHVDAAALGDMIAPETTALIVVDIQKDFAAPDGLLGGYGVDLSGVETAIDRIEELIAAAREAGATVGFMRVVTRPETDSNALKTLMQRRGDVGGEAICRIEDGGADYYRVAPKPGDIEIQKLLFSSFHGTDLDAQLKERGIETLLVCGVSTDCCVDSTAREAFHRNYHVFVISDASAAYSPELHVGPLNVLQKNCALLVSSDAVKQAWQS